MVLRMAAKQQEAHMTMNSRGMIVFTAAVLILSALLVKAVAPRQTVAGTDAANGEVQASVPVYDLHIHHPHMKALPVDDIPEP
jgi:hypothetical protein